MSKKEMKLESYLLITNFIFGVFWIFSGILDFFDKLPVFTKIFNLLVIISLLITLLKGYFSPRENFDELSMKIKNSVDSNILCLSLPLILLFCNIFGLFEVFNISISFPWFSFVKLVIGLLYCLQYIIFIVEIKKIVDFNGENDA